MSRCVHLSTAPEDDVKLIQGHLGRLGTLPDSTGRSLSVGCCHTELSSQDSQPESDIKQLSQEAAFHSSQSISLISSSGLKEPPSHLNLTVRSLLSLIQANVAMELWGGRWWALKIGGYWLSLESEFSWKKCVRG